MIPIDQTILDHNPEEGRYGDCFRAVIASMLELSIHQVPHFMHNDPSDKWETVNKWLIKNYRLRLWTVPFDCSLEDLFKAQRVQNPGIIYMLVGKSPRGVNHQVICKDDKIIHDPHPSREGIVEPTDSGYFWIDVLVFSDNQIL